MHCQTHTTDWKSGLQKLVMKMQIIATHIEPVAFSMEIMAIG